MILMVKRVFQKAQVKVSDYLEAVYMSHFINYFHF